MSSSYEPPIQENVQEFKAKEPAIKAELFQEAGFLTKSIYRTCLRSIRLIRQGNEKDQAEFVEREQKRQAAEDNFDAEDVRLGLFSIMPPGDREDELRSRAEYYTQYARENLFQETDCLPLRKDSVGRLQEQDVQRFILLLKKGEKERRWLLNDMAFQDPYRDSFPKEGVQKFEEKAAEYIRNWKTVFRKDIGASYMHQLEEDDSGDDGDEDAIFDPEEEEEVPQWIRERFPNTAPRHR